jgi:hypothetical protein
MQLKSRVAALRLCLERAKVLSLVDAEGDVACHVDAGLVWITVEGGPADIILRAGERATLPSRRLVVVQALEGAVLELAAAAG